VSVSTSTCCSRRCFSFSTSLGVFDDPCDEDDDDTPISVWLMRLFHPPPPEFEDVVFPDVLVLLERRSSSALHPDMVVIIAAMCRPTPAQSSHHLPDDGIIDVCLPRLPVVVHEEPSKEDPPDTVLMVQLDIA